MMLVMEVIKVMDEARQQHGVGQRVLEFPLDGYFRKIACCNILNGNRKDEKSNCEEF